MQWRKWYFSCFVTFSKKLSVDIYMYHLKTTSSIHWLLLTFFHFFLTEIFTSVMGNWSEPIRINSTFFYLKVCTVVQVNFWTVNFKCKIEKSVWRYLFIVSTGNCGIRLSSSEQCGCTIKTDGLTLTMGKKRFFTASSINVNCYGLYNEFMLNC